MFYKEVRKKKKKNNYEFHVIPSSVFSVYKNNAFFPLFSSLPVPQTKALYVTTAMQVLKAKHSATPLQVLLLLQTVLRAAIILCWLVWCFFPLSQHCKIEMLFRISSSKTSSSSP